MSAGTADRIGTANRTVLVAVERPDYGEQLVRTACDLARAYDSGVKVITVAVKHRESPFAILSDETIIEDYAAESNRILAEATTVVPGDVPIDGEVVVGQSVVHGLTKAADETDAVAAVTGWHEREGRTDAVLGTTVDRLIERLPCDLYVEKIGAEADGVDSILLPVAGGPHVRPAAVVAKAIAAPNDATITVFSVASEDIDREAAREYAARATAALRAAPGRAVEVESVVGDGGPIADRIVEVAADHDIIVFGTTRRSAFRRRLVGSIPRSVADRTDRTIIMARAEEGATGRPMRLSRLWRSKS